MDDYPQILHLSRPFVLEILDTLESVQHVGEVNHRYCPVCFAQSPGHGVDCKLQKNKIGLQIIVDRRCK